MNFALSIIVLTLVVALICFYPLLRSVKAKEDKKRDELNKALYFSRLKEIDQDNQHWSTRHKEHIKGTDKTKSKHQMVDIGTSFLAWINTVDILT